MTGRDPAEPLAASDAKRSQGRGRSMLFRLLRFAVAVGLLSVVIAQIGLSDILGRAASADAVDLLLAFGIFLAVQWLAAWRLKRLMDAQQIVLPVPLVFEVNLAARFYGLFLPGGNLAASLIRVFKFARDGGAMPGVITALFADRMLATLSLCIVGLLFWMPAQAGGLWLAAFAAAFLACLLPVAALFMHSFSFMPEQLARFLRRRVPAFWAKLTVAVQRSRLSGERVMIASLFLSIAMHLVGTVGYWLIAQSLDLPLSLLAVGWVRAAMMLATLLPITLSGIGIRELASLSLLGHFGIDGEAAIAFSLLVFAVMVVGVGLLGGLAEAWRFVRR